MFRCEYNKVDNLFGQEMWVGNGGERFKRVAAGVALPTEDEPLGAVVVLGENYRSAQMPPEFTALSARVGDWQTVEQILGEYRQRFQFGFLILPPPRSQDNEDIELVRRVRALYWAVDKIPLLISESAKYASGEIGRQRTDSLIQQGRLHGITGGIKRELDHSPSRAAAALESVLTYLLETPAAYGNSQPPRLPRSWMSV